MTLDEVTLADEFPLKPGLIYLNHAAVAPWPKRTAQAIQRFADENVLWGATHAKRWEAEEQALRQQCAQLIQAPSSDDIALVKNTSEALSMVAYGIRWQAGDEVVITNQEFPSNRIVWESLQSQGVKLIEAQLHSAESPEQAIESSCSDRTRLISISSVQYATGLRMDLEQVGQIAKAHQALYCIDAIQSLGALPLNALQNQADFVMADAHKWLLGPEGIALFYSKPEAREQLSLYEYGWHMVEAMGQYDIKEWTPAKSARRFECGSPNSLGTQGLSASLSLLLEVGIDRVEQALFERRNYLKDKLQTLSGLDMQSSNEAQRQSGILNFKLNGKSSQEHQVFHKQLLEQQLICAHRGGGIRLSPHFYTPYSVLDNAIEVIRNTLTKKNQLI